MYSVRGGKDMGKIRRNLKRTVMLSFGEKYRLRLL